MTAIDNRGRLFGRINLVDATVVAFLVVLVPLAYGSYLLFRPARPHIESVALSMITKEENRIAGGAVLTAKLKVKGSGFNPLLRAAIGNSPAMGFVFENPNSADVLIGQVGSDDHDLILYDGIQEVARSVNAFTIPRTQPGVSSFIRGVGRFANLEAAAAAPLRVGFKFPEASPEFEILALGPAYPSRSSVLFAASEFDLPLQGLVDRDAVLRIRCDSAITDNPCAIGARSAGPFNPPTVTLVFANADKPYRFVVQEALPETPPRRARVEVRLEGGPHLATLKVGDRDEFLDERAAVIAAVGSRGADAVTVTLELGLDDSRDGWRYRRQRIKPGAPFRLATERYEAIGRVDRVDLLDADKRGGM
jgi:hypothetical protein